MNLDDPEKTILANVIKGSCGVSVVRRYRQLHKLNMLSVTLSGADGSKESDDNKQDQGKDDDENRDTDDTKKEEEK